MVDAALVGVARDASVGDADGHPHGAFFFALTHDLENPALLLVDNRETLALGGIAVGLHEIVDGPDGFAGGARTLQRDIDQGAIVHDARGILQALPAAEGRLHDDELMLVHVADRLVRMGNLRNLSAVESAVPVVDVEHRAPRPVGRRLEVEFAVELVGIGGIGHHAGTVGRSAFGHDDVGAGIRTGTERQQREQAGRSQYESFHK